MDPKVTELYNDYIHGDTPRRSFLKQLAVITGGVTVANTVLALIEPNYARGQQIKPEDERLEQGYISYGGTLGPCICTRERVMASTTTPARHVTTRPQQNSHGKGQSISSTTT